MNAELEMRNGEEEKRGILPMDPTLVNPPRCWVGLYREDPVRGAQWRHRRDGRSVIATVESHGGRLWAHVSIARRHSPPTYADLCYLKEHWLGDCRALMVFPPAAVHVNIHPHCLHLFAAMDGVDGLPEFSRVLPTGLRVI